MNSAHHHCAVGLHYGRHDIIIAVWSNFDSIQSISYVVRNAENIEEEHSYAVISRMFVMSFNELLEKRVCWNFISKIRMAIKDSHDKGCCCDCCCAREFNLARFAHDDRVISLLPAYFVSLLIDYITKKVYPSFCVAPNKVNEFEGKYRASYNAACLADKLSSHHCCSR